MRRFAFLSIALFVVVCSPVGPDAPVRDEPDPSQAPLLASLSPGTEDVRIETGDRVVFHVEATSPRARPLTITFLVDGSPRVSAATFLFEPASAGTFRVSAVVSDGDLETVHEWTVTVADPPNLAPGVALSIEPASGEAPLAARLRVTGADPDGTIVRYRLEIVGPEALAVEQSAPIDTVVTLPAGSWQATAIVEDDRGATTVATRGIEVSAPNRPPRPDLRVDPTSGQAPLDVRVDAGGSDPDGEIALFRLDLDGNGEFEIESPTSELRFVRFERATTSWIRLSVIDDRGAEARDSVMVQVTDPAPPPPPPPPPSPDNAAPTAGLVVSPSQGDAPLEVAARASGADSDGVVVAVRIDFDGDGVPDASGEGQSLDALFRYETPGTYAVTATAVDDDGATATATASVSVWPSQNQPPTGALALSATKGDAPLEVQVSASGSDPDGQIVKWEIEANEGDGFLELDDSRAATLVYAFDDVEYRPRLRLTDDGGATAVIVGPPVTVYRPIAGGSASVSGNPRFDATLIAPAVWSDGTDAWRFRVTVRDSGGKPLAGVPLRVSHTRGSLTAPDGTPLGPGAVLAAGDLRTGDDGTAAGSLVTDLSTRIERAPVIDFQPFAVEFEADAGHGEWRPVARFEGLNANTMVSAANGRVVVYPANQAVCPGELVEIEIVARRSTDAPSPGAPATGRYTELRFTDGAVLGASPRPGYDGWRTDGAGVIRFGYKPTRADQSKLVTAWVDGQPLRELGLIVLEPVSECGS